jgi:RNA polymerase sigma-70 factor (ECF subfamily)
MNDPTDIARLPEALADDLDRAFPDVVRALQGDVFSGALRMTGNRADAEDIAQESFLRAYRAMRGYPAQRIEALQLRAWIWTIAANLCRNRARTLARRRETLDADPIVTVDGEPGPEQRTLDHIGLEDLAALVAQLPWAQRASVVLRHVVGLGYGEIAEALGRPLGTVKSDAHRGLNRLRILITQEAP